MRYGEGVFVGYRGYDASERTVAYPFGHGLSYTTFGYDGLSVSRTGSVDGGDLAVTVSCRVRNTGDRAGREIVQLYVGRPAGVGGPAAARAQGLRLESPWSRAPTGRSSFTLGRPRLRLLVGPGRRAGWSRRASSPSQIGASSRDIRLTETVTIEAAPPDRPLTGMSTLEEWLADPAGEPALRAAIGTDADGTPARHPGQRRDAAHARQLPGVHTGRVRRVRAQPRDRRPARRRARDERRCGIVELDRRRPEYTDLDLSEVRADDEPWRRRRFVRCRFVDADLRGLVTEACSFDECDFTGADLGDSTHRGAALRTCTVHRATLGGSTFRGCSLLGTSVMNCRLRPITLTDCDLTLAALGRADLRETDLSGLRLREANLVEADLRGCDLRGADLAGARLRGTRLEGADLRGARIDPDGWVQARLTGATVDTEQALAFAAAHGLRIT